jgi:L-threonylcarbamoyladenylate synthase
MEIGSNGVSKAVTQLRHRGCVIYPTETFYALGASAVCADAVERIAQLKLRDRGKPMPLILGEAGQLSLLGGLLPPELAELARRFWPGPLSLLVRAKETLPGPVQDREGYVCVRVSSHPLARSLALRAGTPLVATSANRAGEDPPARPRDIDPVLEHSVDAVIREEPWPSGGAPSTIVRWAGGGRLVLVRAGAVSADTLRATGYSLQVDGSRI